MNMCEQINKIVMAGFKTDDREIYPLAADFDTGVTLTFELQTRVMRETHFPSASVHFYESGKLGPKSHKL